MHLKHNYLIEDEGGHWTQGSAESGSELPTAAPLGLVYVFNCTPVQIASLSVNGVALTSLPDGANPGQTPQFVSVNRFGTTKPIFGPSTEFQLTFIDLSTYTQTISVKQPPPASVTLWCFYTGLVLTDPYGAIRQISWGM